MSSANPIDDQDIFPPILHPDSSAIDQGPSTSDLLASIEPVQRTTSIGLLEAIAANLGMPRLENSRPLVEWLIENPDLARRRTPHAAKGPESSLMLRKLPDDVLELVLDELEDRSQPRTTDLLTSWNRLDIRRLASRSLELEALSLVCRRLSRLALPRLRKEMWHELRPLAQHPRHALARGYSDTPSNRSLVWIKGIEHSQARNSIKHLYLYDCTESELTATSLLAPADLAMLLNILSDNLQVLVLKGSSVRSFFQAIDSEPLTDTHMIHTLKLSRKHQPVALEWLSLCCQRFTQLSRLTCAFDRVEPSSRLAGHGQPDQLGWKPITTVMFPRERITHLELNLMRWEDSLAALAELVGLSTHSIETLSLRGRLGLTELAQGPGATLGALLAPTGLRKLAVALELGAERSFFARDHGTPTTLEWIQGLFAARLARLRTLALTLSVGMPRTGQTLPTDDMRVPLLQGLWGSALVGSPQLATVILRTTAKISMGFVAGIDTPVPLVPSAMAQLHRLSVTLDLFQGPSHRRHLAEESGLVMDGRGSSEPTAKLKEWCLNRGDIQWIEYEPETFRSDGSDLFRYF